MLLVEDEPAVRKMAASMVRRLGFTVIEAGDGVEAVDAFRAHQDEICCVVCDLTMPRMNGWETLAALRRAAPSVPVVLVSGYDEASVMVGEHVDRPDAFLAKPYQVSTFRAAIDKAIGARGGL